MKTLPILFAVLALLVTGACGDSSQTDASTNSSSSTGGHEGVGGTSSGGGGASTGGDGVGGVGVGGGALSFEQDIWPILTVARNPPFSGANDSCSGANGCHLNGAGGLTMPTASTAYTNLIDVPSNSLLCGDMLEVVAGSPDQSCFVVFYEQRLRDELGWVDEPETEIIRAWVEQGAAP